MRKEHRTVLTLDETDIDQLEDGNSITVGFENGNMAEITLSESVRHLMGRSDADPTEIPDDLSELHYHRELVPLASEFDVIRQIGTRERGPVEDELRKIREQSV